MPAGSSPTSVSAVSPPAAADRPACLVSVHPHPDDESIAVGGTLLTYGDRGVETHVITCTGGEEGDNLAGIDLGGRDLADLRREEMAAAARVLGLSSHTWLGHRDSGMAGTPPNERPDAFVNVDLHVAAAEVATVLRRLRPQVVLSDDEHGTYGHPDHVMSHRVTVAAVALAGDPAAAVDGDPHRVRLHAAHTVSRAGLRAMHDGLRARGLLSPFTDDTVGDFGVPADRIATTLDVHDVLARKQEAMLAHRSQISRDSAFFNLPEDLAAEVFAHEMFVVLSTAGPLDDQDRAALRDDLFAGWVS